MQVGRLRTCGIAKETVVGTLVTPPTEFFRFLPPDSFYPKVTPIISKAIGTLPDVNIKQTLGLGTLNGLKLKRELEGENCGSTLNACFGTDSAAETAAFIIGSSTCKIDFKEDAGTTRNASIALGTYAMGASSAVNGSLCKAVKTALEGASGAVGTYTVTYSYTTLKMTIAVSGGAAAVQILWLTGANNANGAYSILGFTKVDTSSAASLTSNSTTAVAPFTHTFVRQAVAQLPTYSFWFDKYPLYPQIAGAMLNKLDLEIKSKEMVMMDTEWEALSYDATGITRTPTYSAVRPFTFNQCTVSVDGGSDLNYDDLKLTINNMVKTDHALSGSIYPAKIYSEGMDVDFSATLFFEDAVQYNKFLAGTTAAFIITLTSADDISGAPSGNKYKLVINLPAVVYQVANLPIPSGVLKITFNAKAMYDTVTSKTVNMLLTNGVPTAYSA